jgi:hypothetical protein
MQLEFLREFNPNATRFKKFAKLDLLLDIRTGWITE